MPKPEHAVALAELMAPEALLLTNRLRLTPIGLAVINQQDRLVDALERAVLARLQVAPHSARASCPSSTRTTSTTATTTTITTTITPTTTTTTTTTTTSRSSSTQRRGIPWQAVLELYSLWLYLLW